MKEKLVALWAKVVENKATVIKTGGAVAGAVVGIVVAAIISNAMNDQPFYEEMSDQIDEIIHETK